MDKPSYGQSLIRALNLKGICAEDPESPGAEDVYRVALYAQVTMRILSKGDDPENPMHGIQVQTIPGHYLTTPPLRGPHVSHKCRVLVVNRCPSAEMLPHKDGARQYELMHDEFRSLWLDELTAAGVEPEEVYVTNLVRFRPPSGSKTLKAAWVKECSRLLYEEIEMLQPDVIIAMGRDVVKALFGNGTTISLVRGADYLKVNGISTVCTTHTHALAVDPSAASGFVDDIRIAARILKEGAPEGEGKLPDDVDYRYLYNEHDLQQAVDACLEEKPEWLSVDCEWGSLEKSDYLHGKLRTVQFSWKPKTGYAIALRGPELVDEFEGGEAAALPHIKRLIETSGAKLCGHFFRTDQKFLDIIGVDTSAWENGFDTMLGLHLLQPYADGMGLEQLSMRRTDLGRYDIPLAKWLKENRYNKERLRQRGYGDIPSELLLPYSVADVDVVIRVVPQLIEELQAEKVSKPYTVNGHRVETLYDVYRQFVHPATLAIHDMEKAGVYVDYDKLLVLIDLFEKKKKELHAAFVEKIRWPDFNFRAVDQVKELLFGTQPKKGRIRPENAVSLNLQPLKTTEKPSRDWDSLSEAAIASGMVSPSTDGETLQILAPTYEVAAMLRELRTVDQVIKNFLAQADEHEDGGDDATQVFSKGLASCVDEDMRIRSMIGQLTDSGRYTSSKPNLMNQHKKMETELRRIFALDREKLMAIKGWANKPADELKALGVLPSQYDAIRSCFRAPPGYVFIEADFKQAELNVLAYMAQDENMISIVSNPKRDLHSEMAVKAFRLDCDPKEVKGLYPDLRVMAKAVIFGIAYGRGAAAIVRQLKTEGVDVDVNDAQGLIDTFYEMFPSVQGYVSDCKSAVYTPGYVETAWGRRRYFFPTGERAIDAGLEREAVNHPIQGTVAGCLDLALNNFRQYKAKVEPELDFTVVLPVHDAVIIYTKPELVPHMRDVVIPVCMTYNTQVESIGMTLQTDIDIKSRWDLDLTDDQLEELISQSNGCDDTNRRSDYATT